MITNTEFRIQVQNKINAFKRIYRSNLSPKWRASIQLESLQIKRRQINAMNDIELYDVCKKLTSQLDHIQQTKDKRHQGLDDFINDLEETLKNYRLFENILIHEKSFCQKHLLNIIQHTQNLQRSINKQSLNAIRDSGKTLIEIGDEQCINQLIALMQQHENESRYFAKLATYFSNLKAVYDSDPFLH